MKQLLSLFNLREAEIMLYETLFYSGQMSASQLAKQAGYSRTSVYDLLERLIEAGLTTATARSGIKIFRAESPAKIRLLLEEKKKNLNTAEKTLAQLQARYLSEQKNQPPRLQIFEGKKELQQMMKDMLLYRDLEVRAFWPVKTIIDLLTPAFMEQFHRERADRNINLKVIWPSSQLAIAKQHPFLAVGPTLKREVRLAPAGFNFSLGYAIYGQTVRFLSSQRENFGFLVESRELAEMMAQQFELIWQAGKPWSAKSLAKK